MFMPCSNMSIIEGSFVHELVQRETGAAAGRLNQQLKIRLGGASDEDIDIFDEEGRLERF